MIYLTLFKISFLTSGEYFTLQVPISLEQPYFKCIIYGQHLLYWTEKPKLLLRTVPSMVMEILNGDYHLEMNESAFPCLWM